MQDIIRLNICYVWILVIIVVFILRLLYDANVINGPDSYSNFFSLNNNAEINLIELFSPLILFLIVFKLNYFYNNLNNQENKNKKRIHYAFLLFHIITLSSYYLTRLKFINGPYNYSNYFGKPIILFK